MPPTLLLVTFTIANMRSTACVSFRPPPCRFGTVVRQERRFAAVSLDGRTWMVSSVERVDGNGVRATRRTRAGRETNRPRSSFLNDPRDTCRDSGGVVAGTDHEIVMENTIGLEIARPATSHVR